MIKNSVDQINNDISRKEETRINYLRSIFVSSIVAFFHFLFIWGSCFYLDRASAHLVILVSFPLVVAFILGGIDVFRLFEFRFALFVIFIIFAFSSFLKFMEYLHPIESILGS